VAQTLKKVVRGVQPV